MAHSNISIFVPHIGCPHRCSFCDQNTISGAAHAPSAQEVRETCMTALREVKSPEETEIAFFGGSFTAIPRDYMTELLDAAGEFVGEGRFRGIRCSTRPDCIDSGILELLKSRGVTAIELGAQSMSDHVLAANRRGHTARDVIEASRLIKDAGFELGLQMMIGLYGSTAEDERMTAEKIISIRPDTVRIYPVVILRGTELAKRYESGEYRTFSFDETVGLAADFLRSFAENGIRVIKCGLHASEVVEQDMIGGFYHPAFRELCESAIYRKIIGKVLADQPRGSYTIAVNPSCISKAMGHKKSNQNYYKEQGIDIKVVGDPDLPKYECKLRR